MNKLIAYLTSRLREPSSQAGLTGVAGAIHLISIREYALGFPMLVTGLSAVFISDKVPTVTEVRQATIKEVTKQEHKAEETK